MKNPFMSLWLSEYNKMANAAKGQMMAGLAAHFALAHVDGLKHAVHDALVGIVGQEIDHGADQPQLGQGLGQGLLQARRHVQGDVGLGPGVVQRQARAA